MLVLSNTKVVGCLLACDFPKQNLCKQNRKFPYTNELANNYQSQSKNHKKIKMEEKENKGLKRIIKIILAIGFIAFISRWTSGKPLNSFGEIIGYVFLTFIAFIAVSYFILKIMR
ncbi:hypothetical protein [Polaribacter sp.]|uniref:hypothetical protein n=1 Tax=Polaribacter sp. TaxID=1920175 RepID=UPI0040487895